jgi:hypothetical protein
VTEEDLKTTEGETVDLYDKTHGDGGVDRHRQYIDLILTGF